MSNLKPNSGRDAIIAAEGFVADVQFRIQTRLNDRRMSRADLARRLNVSEARVSHLFAAEAQNLTLRTLAKIFHALDDVCYVTSPRLEELLGPPALDMEVNEVVPAYTSVELQTVIRLQRRSRAQRRYSTARGEHFAADAAAGVDLHAA